MGDTMRYFKRLCFGIIILICCIIGIFIGLGYSNYKTAIQQFPIHQKVSQIQSSKHYVTIDQVSKNLLEATVAIEDHRFYDHFGIDMIGIGRAFLHNIQKRNIVSGGSTITQQLAKNMYYDNSPSIIRKIGEVFLAFDLERKYSKNMILELYVNIIHYGDDYIGIQAASEGYFGVSAKELNLAQSSLLAGLPQSPSNYGLSKFYDRALIRQETVLNAMVKKGIITESQKLEVKGSNPQLNKS